MKPKGIDDPNNSDVGAAVLLGQTSGYEYTIKYKSGSLNIVADALSRIEHLADSSMFIISVLQFEFMDQLQQHLQASSMFQDKWSVISSNPAAYPDYKLQDQLILHKGSIWLDDDNPFRNSLLTKFHLTPLGGHLSVAKTTHRLQENFTWEHLWQNAQSFIKNCQTCQQVKYDTRKLARLLQPLLLPSGIWEDLSLDFITSLPNS